VKTITNQVIYETNADLEASYKNLTTSNHIVADITEKGLLWFRFKGTKTVFMLSKNGKMQVKWNNVEEKKFLLKFLKNLLVPQEGKLKIKPSKQQVWIDYPPPSNFKLYWCDEETEFSQQKKGLIGKESLFDKDEEEELAVLWNIAEKYKFPSLKRYVKNIIMLRAGKIDEILKELKE
jgi:hypothetical protein